MSHDDLRSDFSIVYKCLSREKYMRQRVLRPGPDRQRKIEEIEQALEALTRIKDFAKLHTEEPPEQVALLDDLPTVQRGGY